MGDYTSGDYYLCTLSEKQLLREQRESLISRAACRKVKLQLIKREHIDPLGVELAVVEEIAEGREMSMLMVAVDNKRVVYWREHHLIIRSHVCAEAMPQLKGNLLALQANSATFKCTNKANVSLRGHFQPQFLLA